MGCLLHIAHTQLDHVCNENIHESTMHELEFSKRHMFLQELWEEMRCCGSWRSVCRWDKLDLRLYRVK